MRIGKVHKNLKTDLYQDESTACLSLRSLYFHQLFWVWSRFLLLLAHKMFESDTVGLPQGQQGKYRVGCCIYISCKAADVTLKEIDVET